MNGTTLWVIGDENAVLGFALLGVDGQIVRTTEEARQALHAAVTAGEAGIVMLSADWATTLREEIDRLKSAVAEPFILEIPASSTQAGGPSLRTLLQHVLGIRLQT